MVLARLRCVKILLADDDAARARALARALAEDPTLHVVRIPRGRPLAEAVAAEAPDVVLVDMAHADRDALEGVRALSARAPHPVVLFVDQDDPAFMEQAIAAGVCSYNVLGMPPPDVKPILRAAIALFRHHQRAHSELAERRVLERAKAVLIRERSIGEPAAHRWLQRQAMLRGRRLVEVAREVLRARGEAEEA
ncbi:MAG: ANTAR domain-containing protein [Alphaproteobacteria bacterium]|nr:ANTAR domain-containing protein [Alphaproteobacteria bacterium]